MRILEGIIQGSNEWYAHRSAHFTASEAPAVMGLSKYKTRSALLHEKATGITPEIDASTQRRFDAGHEAEAATRGIAEKIIGEELFPATGTETVDGLPLLASFDGITMLETAVWENKLWNEGFAAQVRAGEVPDTHWPQLEHQMLVTGVEKVLFTVSDGENVVHLWYSSHPERRAHLIAAWKQFAIDLKNYQRIEHAEKPKAEICIELPALFVHAKGEITTHNMKEFGEALQAKLEEVRAIALISDQDFSNAKAAAKMFRDKAKEIALSKEAMLSQTVTIGEAARMMDAWSKDLNGTALQLEKDVEREDLAKKRVMVCDAGIAFSAHVEALEAETRPIQLNVPRPDFATAIKGKRNYASMQGALDDALAQGKIAADAAAKDIRTKKVWFGQCADGCEFLFNDLQQIIAKQVEDFQLIVTSRIKDHKAAEAKKEEDLRAKVQAEEAAKLEAERALMQAQEEAKAKAAQDALLAAERVKMEAEVKAKAEEELASKPVYGAEQAQNTANANAQAAKQAATYGTAAIQGQTKVVEASALFKPSRKAAKAAIMGRIEVVEDGGDNFKTDLGLLIVFETPEQLRAALENGVCEFTFGEEEAAA